MKKNWSRLKELIGVYEKPQDLFLSLINEEGQILCANANMVRKLHLKNPRKFATNFFDLLHPLNLNSFKKAIRHSTEEKNSYEMELVLKNGSYHPMKWEVNFLSADDENMNKYLCVGHKLHDDDRLIQFNRLGEKYFQLIAEGFNTGVLFHDKKGELIAANRKTSEILATSMQNLYQSDSMINLWNKVWEVKKEHGNPMPFESAPFMKALKKGEHQSEVLSVMLDNGECLWLDFSSQPLFEEGSNVPFAALSRIVDISEEKRLSALLKEKETLFNVFIKKTPNLAWVVDEDSNLVFASQSFYLHFGLNESTSIKKNIAELVPKHVADSLYEKHVQVLHTGKPAELVEKVKWANGSDLVFHITIFPITGLENKKMLGGQAVNISDKFDIEKQLKEANNRLLLLSRATSDAIWEWDMQTARIFRNDILMDIIGYSQEQTKGLSWWLRRIHPEDRNRVSDKVKDTTDKNLYSWAQEYRFKCADGNYKHIHDKGYVVYENGLPVKMIGSLQDVSGLKQLENQLMEEKMERQKELTETVIQVQEKERTRIGHELHDNVNQILSTAKLFVDMLTPPGKEQKSFKEKSLEYIILAIEEIRKLSKELVVPQLHSDGLVTSICSLVDDIHLSKKIIINFTHDRESELLSPGKKVTIFRIVQEQMKNILKHSKASNVNLIIRTTEQHVELIIEDNGAGFDFKQTHRGIGLSNIYERTRFYNGTIKIDTAPGKGCKLTVNIPVL
jgi:PAS domain S-box-containing protein